MESTLFDFLTRSGYSLKRHRIYERRLDEFQAAFSHKTIYSPTDIEMFCSTHKQKTIREHMKVIEKYLRFTLKLTDTPVIADANTKDINDLIKQYLDSLVIKNYRRNSIDRYRYMLGIFTEYLSTLGIKSIHQVDRNVLNSFKNHLYMRPTASGSTLVISTQQAIINTVKQLFKYLLSEKVITINPARRMKVPRSEHRISQNHFTQDEVLKFLDCIDTSTAYGFLDRTLFELLYSTGMRINELLNLGLTNVRLDDYLITIFDDKTRKDRVAVLTPVAHTYLTTYISSVRTQYMDVGAESDLVFPSVTGILLDYKYISNRMVRYLRLAGIEKQLSSHAFRRSFATHLLEQGVDIRFIQTLLGHSKIDSTMAYIKISTKDLRSVLVKHHPREAGFVNKTIQFMGNRRYE